MPVLPYLDDRPALADDVFIAPDAFVVGRVRIGRGSSLWFGSVVRGDTGHVELGEEVNLQEGCIVHTQAEGTTRIGNRTSLGHRSLVHAADVGEDCLVGIGASILTGATVGPGTIVAAHSLVPEGMAVPAGSLVMGTPGRVIRAVREDEHARIVHTAAAYVRLAAEYRASWPSAVSRSDR